MKYVWIEESSGNGPVLRINSDAQYDGELEGVCDWTVDGIWGKCADMYTVVGGVFTPKSQTEVDVVLAASATEAEKQSIAEQRYEMETADIEYDGHIILNDRASRTLIESAMEKIRRGLVASIRWKCRGSYLDLTAENIDAIELLGMQQIQTAFAWEEAQIAALEGE